LQWLEGFPLEKNQACRDQEAIAQDGQFLQASLILSS
jgi:hypothetical protein